MSSTPISAQMQKAARDAVAPSSKMSSSSMITPSWTSIVEAYHKEGNGDREMLLALLQAKAKEDERLAAIDLLRAEQMRAYSAHIAVHGPLYPPYPHHHQTKAVPTMAVTLPSPAPSASSSSRRVSAASSNRTNSTSKKTASRASEEEGSSSRSRAPSLTNSVSSAGSSPASPAEGTLLLNLSAAAASIASSHATSAKPCLEDAQKVVLTAGQIYSSSASPPGLKRRRSLDADVAVVVDEPAQKKNSHIVSSTRDSPTLPGIASFDQYTHNAKSIQHILNADRRLSNAVRTSDVRSSSASDDE